MCYVLHSEIAFAPQLCFHNTAGLFTPSGSKIIRVGRLADTSHMKSSAVAEALNSKPGMFNIPNGLPTYLCEHFPEMSDIGTCLQSLIHVQIHDKISGF